MSTLSKIRRTATCACGSVEFEAVGAPIVCVACYCDDCQEAARQIEALPQAGPVQELDGGTACVVYRKDRVRCTKGADLLTRHKLREASPTNRLVATCCNSAMLLNFDDAKHWVDLYRSRLQGDIPPLQMRVCTRFKPGAGELPGDIPSYPGFAFSFLAKLLAARLAMLLGR